MQLSRMNNDAEQKFEYDGDSYDDTTGSDYNSDCNYFWTMKTKGLGSALHLI